MSYRGLSRPHLQRHYQGQEQQCTKGQGWNWNSLGVCNAKAFAALLHCDKGTVPAAGVRGDSEALPEKEEVVILSTLC